MGVFFQNRNVDGPNNIAAVIEDRGTGASVLLVFFAVMLISPKLHRLSQIEGSANSIGASDRLLSAGAGNKTGQGLAVNDNFTVAEVVQYISIFIGK